ncbi:asparagine synthase (glutamine-hydrolyzing) [Polaromonas jejuensis]|uniref:asparagine synthase (glutamine-hydrolyzing) n=1 Tax=Polaromonas jejuensis TaxID=457502 RepID=A0ABW0QC07_9BURK|nr:asparagine synthase (glutamine-hydrolyzing) [Polaromonas jejuensis]
MCGFVGVVHGDDAHRYVGVMSSTIGHRGPDSAAVANLDDRSSFGHHRLSIIDIDVRSSQPFSKDGYTIAFNGEIYNFLSLRQDLDGVVFVSESDTEVILEAWRRWGVNCLSRLRGMFAFAIFEHSTGKYFVCRDQFGIKPVFYYKTSDGGLAFASELKALESVYRSKFTLNHNALLSSLLYCWVPENLCIWNEVDKLQPGHYLEFVDDKPPKLHRFWSLDSLCQQPLLANEDEAVELLNSTLENSVQSHLVADVPVSAFLSGGLDSSLIVAMAAKQLGKVNCYSIKFRGADSKAEGMADDAFYARRVADHLGVKLDMIEVQPDVAKLLPSIVHSLDEPIGDSAAIATLLICEHARGQGIKVLLSGMGADELFGGYRKHLANKLAAHYRSIPSAIRKGIIAPVVNALPVSFRGKGLVFSRWARRFTSFAERSHNDAFMGSYTYYSKDEFSRLVCDGGAAIYERFRAEHETIFSGAFADDLINRMCFTDTQHFMPSLNLAYTDRASMAASTEVRVPFIDKEVAALAMRIPGSMKIKGNTQKYILKKVAERWLPKDVIYRPKSSFTLPIRAWIKGELRDMVDDYVLSDHGLAGRGLLQRDYLKQLVERDRSGHEDNAQRIWQLLTVEQWLRNHNFKGRIA